MSSNHWAKPITINKPRRWSLTGHWSQHKRCVTQIRERRRTPPIPPVAAVSKRNIVGRIQCEPDAASFLSANAIEDGQLAQFLQRDHHEDLAGMLRRIRPGIPARTVHARDRTDGYVQVWCLIVQLIASDKSSVAIASGGDASNCRLTFRAANCRRSRWTTHAVSTIPRYHAAARFERSTDL